MNTELEKLEEKVRKYELMMTFATCWRNYAEEYDDLICWERLSDEQIYNGLKRLGQSENCSFEESQPPMFKHKRFSTGIIGKLKIDDYTYMVGRDMRVIGGNPYDSNDSHYETLTLYDADGKIIVLEDEKEIEKHKQNLSKVRKTVYYKTRF